MTQFVPSGGSKKFVPDKTQKPAKNSRIIATTNKEFNAAEANDPRKGPIKAWSFSALEVFEKCAYRAFLSKVEKIPTESSPALERGNRVHEAIEHYIQGQSDILIKEVKSHRGYIDDLRKLYAEGSVMIEDEWAYDTEWSVTEYRTSDAWCRMKLDAMINEDETTATVVDWKTGQKYGLKHSQQGQLYAIGAFLMFPKLQNITVIFKYTDRNEELEKVYSRDEAMYFLPKWTERGRRMTSATEFPPSPSPFNCKWCDYKDHCEWSL